MSKTLDRVSKLLAKAENAGTPEEAAAFMAKAQEVGSIHGIDLAVARMHQAKKERLQEPEERRIQCNPHARRHYRKHFAELCMAICDVNDVEYLIGGNQAALFCVGFPEDLDMVEALFTHLSIQMATECDEALARGDHREEQFVLVTERREIPWEEREWGQWNGRQWYDENPDDEVYCRRMDDEDVEAFQRRLAAAIKEERDAYLKAVKDGTELYSQYSRGGYGGYRKPVPPPSYEDVPVLNEHGAKQMVLKEVTAVDARVFRSHFYEAFVPRMRGRMWEARRAVERDLGIEREESTDTALALRDKKKEVEEAHEEQRSRFTHLGTYTPAAEEDKKRDHTGRGRRAGARAADQVPIGEGREVK